MSNAIPPNPQDKEILPEEIREFLEIQKKQAENAHLQIEAQKEVKLKEIEANKEVNLAQINSKARIEEIDKERFSYWLEDGKDERKVKRMLIYIFASFGLLYFLLSGYLLVIKHEYGWSTFLAGITFVTGFMSGYSWSKKSTNSSNTDT